MNRLRRNQNFTSCKQETSQWAIRARRQLRQALSTATLPSAMKSLFQIFLVIFILYPLSATTIAAPEDQTLADQYRNKYEFFLNTLAKFEIQAMGLRKDGSIAQSAQVLKNGVRFVAVKNLKKSGESTRHTAMADCATNTVYVSQESSTPPSFAIVIHEALGALCIEDVNYQLSAPLSILLELQSNRRAELNRVHVGEFWSLLQRSLAAKGNFASSLVETLHRQAVIKKSNSVAISGDEGGSITIIGDAGDGWAAAVKTLALKKLLNSSRMEGYASPIRLWDQFTNRTRLERVRANREVEVQILRGKNKWEDTFYFYISADTSIEQAALWIFDCVTLRAGVCK